MTIIKQRAVSAKIHAKHLRAYINDERALMRDVQNIARREAWFKEMDETREVAGHNTAARKGAKNTVMYHQVLAFLPEECDVNGGRLTPELCMVYAKEYAQTRYPNQQIVFALHRERCKEDGIERYAVHMAINRTDLETLKRLDEGTGAKAKRERAAAVRALDERWCLQQVEEGKPNSRIHRQQPRDVEKKMLEQGKTPIKTALRDACHRALRKARDMDEYRAMLDAEGISTRICRGKLYATDRSNEKYEFSLPRLDNRFNSNLLRACFARNNGGPSRAAHQRHHRWGDREGRGARGESRAGARRVPRTRQGTVQSLRQASQADGGQDARRDTGVQATAPVKGDPRQGDESARARIRAQGQEPARRTRIGRRAQEEVRRHRRQACQGNDADEGTGDRARTR